jgi:uncharacterized protein
MNCPRCKTLLTAKTVLDNRYFVNLDFCSSCGGIWFDAGELERLEKTIEPTFFEIRKIPDAIEQQMRLNCPVCDDHHMLEKMTHPRDHKVVMDYCPTCKGVWLDTGEIEAIRTENWIFLAGKFLKWLV